MPARESVVRQAGQRLRVVDGRRVGYYPILDHAPTGRDDGEAWQLWIRRHDEYESA